MKEFRGKGITTAKILTILGSAIAEPGEAFSLYDYGFCKTKGGADKLVGLVLYYIKVLRLKEIVVTRKDYNVIVVSNWKGVEVEVKHHDGVMFENYSEYMYNKHVKFRSKELTNVCEEKECNTIIDKNQRKCGMHRANYIFPEGEIIPDEY